MRTRELADRVGVNSETVRYDERRGLLAEPPRTPGGDRDYPASTPSLLALINRAQELGFTLDEQDQLPHLDGSDPDSCDTAHDSLTALVDTCELPRADRNCAWLEALAITPAVVR